MPIYEFRCRKCLKEEETILPMAERNKPRICECGGLQRRLMSLPRTATFPLSRRDRILKTLNKDPEYVRLGKEKHDPRYIPALASGLEKKAQPGRYRSGIGSSLELG